MAKKYKDQSRLEFVSSGNGDGRAYIIGIRHTLPDPTEDLSSTVFELILSSDGLEWEPLIQGASFFDYPSWFTCLAMDPNGTLYVGEGDGFIKYKNNKSEYVSLDKIPDLKGNLQCAYSRGVDDIIFGSYYGEVVHVQGGRVSVHKIGKSRFEHVTARFSRIHGIGSEFIVIVGDGGNIGCYRAGSWERIRPPSNAKLEAVWCRSQTEIYVGGWEGHVWRWDGGDKWQKMEAPVPEEGKKLYITDFAEYEGILYAACGDRGIHRLEGDKLVPIPKVKSEHVGRLATTNLGLVGLGGVWGDEGSWFTLFDGTSWRATQIQLKRV